MNSDDNCPAWAHEQLVKLRALEISLGNIPPEGDFNSQVASEGLERLFSEDGHEFLDDTATDILFAKIVISLSRAGFSGENIVLIVNSRVGYRSGPPYCDIGHVAEVLEKAKITSKP